MLMHITAKGQEVPLSGMTDLHLTNTIVFIPRPVAERTKAN